MKAFIVFFLLVSFERPERSKVRIAPRASRWHYAHNSIKTHVKRSVRSATACAPRRRTLKQLLFGPELACPDTELAKEQGEFS
jgi:hypothetical protein